jgi:hypothetical protein
VEEMFRRWERRRPGVEVTLHKSDSARASLRQSCIDGERAVVVAVRSVSVMEMTGDEVVDVIAVWNGFVAAAGSVPVVRSVAFAVVVRRATGRILRPHAQRVFIEVTVVREVQVTIVQIVTMPVVHDRRVSAAGAMPMRMTLVRFVLHLASLRNADWAAPWSTVSSPSTDKQRVGV